MSNRRKHHSVSQKRIPPPIGIQVSFIATFITIIIQFYLFYIGQGIDFDIQLPYKEWFLVFVCILVLRHNLRIVFIDSSASFDIDKSWRKFSLWYLFPLAVMGGLTLITLGLNLYVGSIFLLLYTVLFFLFWVFIMIGMKSLGSKKLLPAGLSAFADVTCILFWSSYLNELVLGIETMKIEGEISNASIAGDGLSGFLIIVVLIISVECTYLYTKPLFERIQKVNQLLKTA